MPGEDGRAMKLLVINWQDIKNPQAGGAEVHLHEIFGRLVRRGHRVTLLCSSWPGATPVETVDGMTVHRVGRRHSFTLRAMPYYRRYLRGEDFDLGVEDINKIPLFSPLWLKMPVVALIPHLFGTTAFNEVPVPFATAVWLAERPVPFVYEDVPFQAISESTADDLAARGVPRARVRVIPPGIDHERFRPDPQVVGFAEPTFAYVGRLKRYKGLEVVIDATARLAAEGVEARLLLAGKGDHEAALREYAAERAPDSVTFLGFVSEAEKVDLLRKAWATVYPSPKEGWGITNVEAAASGTPALDEGDAANRPRQGLASQAANRSCKIRQPFQLGSDRGRNRSLPYGGSRRRPVAGRSQFNVSVLEVKWIFP